jgi:hypothetical protein
MTTLINRKTISSLGAVCLCLFASMAWADDVDDVLAFIDQYAALEGDLEKQASMIRDDRVMIAGSARQTDQKENMAVQMAQRDANNALFGGAAKWMLRTESPEVRVYGDTAVASYVRLTSIFPPGVAPINNPPLWVTLVLVKERGNWGIAHTHISPIGN